MARLLIVLLLLFTSFTIKAQSLCEKLSKLKTEYYGFKPNSLNKKQTESKSAQLDKFWELAKTDPEKALPCLRDMIMAENNDPYFCFDASTLVLTLDKKEQYLDVILEGVRKCDLKELQGEPFLRVAYFLGNKGKNISALTEKLMSTPGAHVFLAQHAINLSAADASIFLYNLMSTKDAEDNLFKIIADSNPTGKRNAAIVLTLLSTAKGDSLLDSLIANNKMDDSTKTFILKDKADMIKSAKTERTAKDEEAVREERRKTITGLSDESLERYFSLTCVLMKIRNEN